MTSFRRFARRIGLVALMALVITACSSDATYLPALLADPMASYTNPGLEVGFRDEIPQGHTFFGLSEVDAAVITGFELVGDADAVREDVIAAAESAGWSFVPGSPFTGAPGHDTTPGHETWLAEKELSERLATLTITLTPPDTGSWDFSIALRFEERD